MLVTHYLCMASSKIEITPLVLASLETKTPAFLRMLDSHALNTLGKMLIAIMH